VKSDETFHASRITYRLFLRHPTSTSTALLTAETKLAALIKGETKASLTNFVVL
jgi:hypothetical protein